MRESWNISGRKARFGMIILVAALVAVAVGVQRGGSAGKASDTMVIAIPGTPQGTDLDRESGPQTWTITAQVLELGLEWKRIAYPYPPHGGINNNKVPGFTYPALTKQIAVPGLLTKCDLQKGGRVAIYHLRHGVKSAYGNEFTADDVIWHTKRAIANNAIGAFLLGAANASKISQWHKVDKYTVKITSATAMPLICPINTNEYWVYLDSTEVKKHTSKSDPWGNNWVPFHGDGFGPYYITSWVPGQQVLLKTNPNYWGGAPKIKNIIYKVVPESANRVALLEAGSVQMVEGLSPDDILALNKRSNVHPIAVRSSLSIYLVMNNKQAPFSNQKVRQAIEYAIPRDQIVKNVYRGFANPWQGVFPSLYPGFIPFHSYTYNIAKAKALLAQAGYPKGFKTVMTYNSGDPVQANLGIVLQTSLKQIGINATLQQQPPGPYSSLIQSKKGTFGLWLDFPIQPDPNYSMRLLYLTGNAVNYQNYSDPRVDQILQKCVSLSGAARLKCNKPAENIIYNSATLGWINEPDYLSAVSSNVGGWGWYTTQYYHVSSMYYTK
jgi:peptide/nickel transport system substrate-binding protein